MLKKFSGTAIAGLILAGLALLSPSIAEAATTWVKTSGTTHNAYSWNAYKARIYPSSYPTAPSGYKAYKKTVTVKTTGGTTLATKVTSSLRSPGTYKAYSYFTYRKQVPYTVTQTLTGTTNDYTLSSCTVTGQETPDSYLVSCTGTASEDYSNSYPATWENLYFSPWSTSYAVGDTVSADDLWGVDAYGSTFTYMKKVTMYKNYYAYKYRWRYATVKKVVNYSTVTLTEYKTICVEFWDGCDTLTRVRSVFGSSGTRTDVSYSGDTRFDTYRWKQSNGDYVYVFFENGRAYSKSWW